MISLDTAKHLGFSTVILQIGTKTIEYFTGIPTTDEKLKRAIWTMPDLVRLVEEAPQPVMLLIDDAHLAQEETVKVLWEMLSSRTLHNYPFPPETKLVFAANPYTEEFGSTVSNMPKPIRSRVHIITMENDVQTWLGLSYQRKIHPFVTGFVSSHKQHFMSEPDAEGMYCSPRGWWNLSNYLDNGFELTSELVKGFSGSQAAEEFVVFHNTYLKFIDNTPVWQELKTEAEKAAFITYLLINDDMTEIKRVVTSAAMSGVSDVDTVFLTVLIKMVKSARGDKAAADLMSDVTPEDIQKIVSLQGGM